MLRVKPPYDCITNLHQLKDLPTKFILGDHINGFLPDLSNKIFDQLNSYAKQHNKKYTIIVDQQYPKEIHNKYPALNITFSLDLFKQVNPMLKLTSYTEHPELFFKNFVCSFNGSDHVSRQLLTSILNNRGYFDPEYSSKNFARSNDQIVGHLNALDLSADEVLLYSKFFVNSETFNNTVYRFGDITYNHDQNIYVLENKIVQSFLHIVSETMATSYYPFVTEKFLYSIVTRGLFLAYAPLHWHEHIEKYYGFRKYTKIFDYEFDNIQNPVKRLIKMIEMISKFSTLSTTDWRDLYLLEQETVEYNYNHYFSGDYLKLLQQHESYPL